VQPESFDIQNLNYLILQNSYLEIHKFFAIELQRYRDKTIRVCGKELIPMYTRIFVYIHLKNTDSTYISFLFLSFPLCLCLISVIIMLVGSHTDIQTPCIYNSDKHTDTSYMQTHGHVDTLYIDKHTDTSYIQTH